MAAHASAWLDDGMFTVAENALPDGNATLEGFCVAEEAGGTAARM
jgi:hypothetical protein